MDPLARGLAIAGIVLAVLGLALTWFLWFRSGPRLSVSAFVSAESGTVRITVTCTGRLPTTVRTIELRDHVVITSQASSTVLSRWAIAATPNDRPLPADLAPTAYLEATVEVQKILDASSGLRDVTVRALAERGDGKWYASTPFRVR